jgi:hypothetical protein
MNTTTAQHVRRATNGATSLPPGSVDGGVPAGRVVLSIAVGVIGTVLPLLSDDLRKHIQEALNGDTDRQWLHYVLMLVIVVALLATPGLSDCLVRTLTSAGVLYLWLVALAKCPVAYMGGAVGLMLAGMVVGRYVGRPHLVPHSLRHVLTPDNAQLLERVLYAAAAAVTAIGVAVAAAAKERTFTEALAWFFDSPMAKAARAASAGVVAPSDTAVGFGQAFGDAAASTLTTAPTTMSFANY